MQEKSEQVFNLFKKQIQVVFDQTNRNISFPDHLQQVAGLVQYIRDSKHSLDRPLEVRSSNFSLRFPLCLWLSDRICRTCLVQVIQKADLLSKVSTGHQIVSTYSQTIQFLEEMERKTFAEWSQNLEVQYLKRLEQPLMVRCKDNTTKLDLNFDKWVRHTRHTARCTLMQGTLYRRVYFNLWLFSSHLLDLFSEIQKWDKLKYEIPQCASDIYQHRQELEGLREETLLLIKNYNRCDTHNLHVLIK